MSICRKRVCLSGWVLALCLGSVPVCLATDDNIDAAQPDAEAIVWGPAADGAQLGLWLRSGSPAPYGQVLSVQVVARLRGSEPATLAIPMCRDWKAMRSGSRIELFPGARHRALSTQTIAAGSIVKFPLLQARVLLLEAESGEQGIDFAVPLVKAPVGEYSLGIECPTVYVQRDEKEVALPELNVTIPVKVVAADEGPAPCRERLSAADVRIAWGQRAAGLRLGIARLQPAAVAVESGNLIGVEVFLRNLTDSPLTVQGTDQSFDYFRGAVAVDEEPEGPPSLTGSEWTLGPQQRIWINQWHQDMGMLAVRETGPVGVRARLSVEESEVALQSKTVTIQVSDPKRNRKPGGTRPE